MIALVALAPTAATVLADVQKHYASTQQLTVAFTEKVTLTAFGKTQTSAGTMYLAKPNLLRADYFQGKKLEKSFIFNGTTLWLVQPPTLQVTKMAATGSSLPAVVSFLTGGNLAATFNVTIAGNTLALTPKQPSAQVKELDFIVDPKTWDVTESVLTAPSGDLEDFVFTNPSTAAIKPSLFQFSPSSVPNYKVVTMPAAPTPPTPPPPSPTPTTAIPAKP